MPYYAKKKTTYRRKPAKKARKPAKRYKSLPTLVKREIQKAAEVKRTSGNPVNYQFASNNAFMSNPVDLMSLFVSIPQGAGDGERVGEQIRTKSAKLKMLITANDDVPSSAAILQLFIGYTKNNPGDPPSSVNGYPQIFDDGAGVASSDGTMISLLRSVNTDIFRMFHYRQIKIGQADSASAVNNDFPIYRKMTIDLTKHIGLLKFPTGAASAPPTNKHMYLFCNWVDPSGLTPSTQPPKLDYYLDYTYTDL